MADAVDADLDSLMYKPILVHAGTGAGFVKKIHRDLFDDSGADTGEDVFAGVPFEDDVVDPVPVEELSEEQTGWSGTNDRDLGAHDFS
jgi:hypothetical protein